MRQYEYQEVADYFIALSNETHDLITNLKLQKLMYYSQAFYLATYGKRFFNGTFEAWVHGPVMVNLYNDYRQFKYKPIIREDLNDFDSLSDMFDKKSTLILNKVVDRYFGLSAFELERMTHKEKPWRKARGGLAPDEPSNQRIEDCWMAEYYKKYLDDNAE